MKILLVYPQYPDTFWSFKHAMKFISKKAVIPPLGLLTVAAMLPGALEKKLVDMNVTQLIDRDIKWADYIFISADVRTDRSAREVTDRWQKIGGENRSWWSLCFLRVMPNSARLIILFWVKLKLPCKPFLEDLQKGIPRHIYNSEERPDLSLTPLPLWSLIDMNKYSNYEFAVLRGCPFDCEFCDIVILNGHTPRTKNRLQLISELDSLYEAGWRGGVFIVDDNFIVEQEKTKDRNTPRFN